MDWKYLFTSFDGRINRAKFWAGVGVIWAVSIVMQIIDAVTGMVLIPIQDGQGFGPLTTISLLVSIYVGIALYAKRWHDRDKSGWWSLIMLVPLVGPIWMLVECGILPGTQGPNRFGPDPLG